MQDYVYKEDRIDIFFINLAMLPDPFLWHILGIFFSLFITHNPQLLVISPHNLSPYFADGTDDGIADAVRNLLSPATNQFDNPWYRFEAEMSDYNYYAFLVLLMTCFGVNMLLSGLHSYAWFG